MRPQAKFAPSVALNSKAMALVFISAVVRNFQPSSLKAAPMPSHFCAAAVSFTVTVAVAVESVGMASVFQYAPGAEVTSGGRLGVTTVPPALPAVPMLPAVPTGAPLAPAPGLAPAVPTGAPPLPVPAVGITVPLPAVGVPGVPAVPTGGAPPVPFGAPAPGVTGAPAAPAVPGVPVELLSEPHAATANTRPKLVRERNAKFEFEKSLVMGSKTLVAVRGGSRLICC